MEGHLMILFVWCMGIVFWDLESQGFLKVIFKLLIWVTILWSSFDGKWFLQMLLCLLIACPLEMWDKIKWRRCLSSCFIAPLLPTVDCCAFRTDEYCFPPNYFCRGIVAALWCWVMIPAIIKILWVCVLKTVSLIYDCNFVSFHKSQ